MMLRVLAVSDEVDQRIYSPSIRERMGDIDMVISCGDLPATYLEFLTDALHKEVYYVLGNHAEELTREGEQGTPRHPEGCTDVGFKIVRDPLTGLIIAGLPGSPRYSDRDPIQFTEMQMAWQMLRMAPRLCWNKFRYGRALDLLVTHTPPRDIGDGQDPAHRGFTTMHRFLERWQPAYQLHGHIHLYDRTKETTHSLHSTTVINIFPYQRLGLEFSAVDDPREPTVTTTESIRSTLDADGMEAPHQ